MSRNPIRYPAEINRSMVRMNIRPARNPPREYERKAGCLGAPKLPGVRNSHSL